MSVLMVPADRADAADIHRMEMVLFPHDAWSKETIDSELGHPDSYYLVLRDSDTNELVGYAGLRASLLVAGQGDIQTMAVGESHRGQGLGSRLLEALLAEAWRRRVDEVFLEVRADNRVAQSLYARAGFREIARRPGYYQPGQVDAIVMRKARDDKEHNSE